MFSRTSLRRTNSILDTRLQAIPIGPQPVLSTSKPIRFRTLHNLSPRLCCDRTRSTTSSLRSGGRFVSSSREVESIIKSRGRNLRLTPTTLHPTPSFTSSSPVYHPYNPQRRSFSSSLVTMTATKIDGTAIAKSIRERLQSEIESTQKSNPRYKPSLKIIQGNKYTPSLCHTANMFCFSR